MNPLLLMIPAMLQALPGIVSTFHKDDPKNPTMDPAQAPMMLFQQMMPMMAMLSMAGGNASMLPMLEQMMKPSTQPDLSGIETQLKSLAERVDALEKKSR